MTQLSPDTQAVSLLASLIEERTGLAFTPDRYDILVDKVRPRMREITCPTVLDYYYLLRYDSSGGDEWKYVYSALAVNETYFWREYDQIRAMVEVVAPAVLRNHPEGPVRIWHAACASGEEPYSVVISLMESNPALLDRVEIVGTDLNQEALEQARQGVYRQRSFRAIPPDLKTKYFSPLNHGQYRLSEEVRSRVNFKQLNLLDEGGMAAMSSYDMIMCRNVFIYFNEPAIRRVVSAFHRALNPVGYLFVASAESLLRVTNRFELVEISGAFGYRKLPPIQLPSALTGENE